MSTKEEIIDLLRERVEELCGICLPGGKRVGHEWLCGSINGEAGKSLHVELRGPKAGMWKDHAGDDGGDVLKLVQMSQGLPGFRESMDWARDWLGLPKWTPDPNSKPPFDPLKYSFKDRYGTRYWTYRDKHGVVIGYVVRFENGEGKDIIPLRIIDGQPKWKGWTGEEHKPLYNIDQLARRPKSSLLVVEGEKTADAARKLFPDRVVLTWQGGSKAVKNVDWQPVIDHIAANIGDNATPGYTAIVWPDADEPGRRAAKYLRTLLPACSVVDTSHLPDGWDLADEPPEEVDVQALLDAAPLNIPAPKPPRKEKKPLPEENLAASGPVLHGDVQQPLEMELPEGIVWQEKRHDIIEHGLFFHRNVLYSKRVDTNKYGEVFRIWFHPIANFHIRILQILEDEKESQYLLRIENVKGRTRTFHTATDMLLTSGNLKKALLGKGDFRYTGNEREADFERLVKKLLDEMGDGQKIDVLGWQHDTHVYAMNDALITTKPDPEKPGRSLVLRYDEFGSCVIDGKHYYVPSANKIFARSPYKYLPQKRFRYVESGVTFEQLGKLMVEVHREHGMIALVFVVACLFSSKIFAHHGFFPMGCLYGEPSTGKSKLTQALQHFFGDRQEAMQITGKSTDKAKIRKFAQLIDGLVVLEEFSNSIGDNGFQWLKGLNDRNGYERGTIDSNFGTDNVPITSGVILTGNDYPQNDALLTRLVVIEMLKNQFTPAEQKKFGELTDMMEKGYSCIISELMLHRDAFEEEYKACYKKSLTLMTENLGMAGITLERMVQNPSILMAVFMFFERRLKWPMTQVDLTRALTEAMVAQNNKRDTGGDKAKWWASIAAAIKQEDLMPGEDFVVDGDKLFIRFLDCHEQYMIYHKKLFGVPGHVTSTMRTKLEKSPEFIEHVKAKKFGNVNSSAYVFSMTSIGEEFMQSIIMKRTSKWARRGGGHPPPPGDNGTNGQHPPNGPSGAPVSEAELDLMFGEK